MLFPWGKVVFFRQICYARAGEEPAFPGRAVRIAAVAAEEELDDSDIDRGG